MNGIVQGVNGLRLPQEEAVEAATAAVQALPMSLNKVRYGDNVILTSLMEGTHDVLVVRPDGTIFKTVADTGWQGIKWVVTNVRGL
jgi:hypothetical protein